MALETSLAHRGRSQPEREQAEQKVLDGCGSGLGAAFDMTRMRWVRNEQEAHCEERRGGGEGEEGAKASHRGIDRTIEREARLQW